MVGRGNGNIGFENENCPWISFCLTQPPTQDMLTHSVENAMPSSHAGSAVAAPPPMKGDTQRQRDRHTFPANKPHLL